MLRSFIPWFLTLTLSLNLVSCSGGLTDSSKSADEVFHSLTETYAFPEEEAGVDTDYIYQFDEDAFRAELAKLTEAAGQSDAATILALYDELYDQIAQLDEDYWHSYLLYCDDVTDDDAYERNLDYTDLYNECLIDLTSACYSITQGPCAEEFRRHVGEDDFAYFAAYSAPSEREEEINHRETELLDDYYAVMADEDTITYRYGGQDWTWSMFEGTKGDRLYYRDYEGYCEVYYGLIDAQNAAAAPIYLELVELRKELAELNGYDSYNEYAYENLYVREYSPDDAQRFCDEVKDGLADTYVRRFGESDLWYEYEYTSIGNTTTLLALFEEYIPEFGDRAVEAFSQLKSSHLYDIGMDDNRMNGAFTISMGGSSTPYIYMTSSGTCYDFLDFSHEFGHFTDAYINPVKNLLVDAGSYDLFEIHSQGMQALFTFFYNDIFGDDAGTAAFLNMAGLVDVVVAGCLYDEFQRMVYDSPAMTVEELNELFAALEAEYGIEPYGDYDGSWIYVEHNFDSPLYYLSYAVSALAAMEIWDIACEDFEQGLACYWQVVDCGAYDEDYTTVVTKCGLTPFMQAGAAETIVTPVLEYLDLLDS